MTTETVVEEQTSDAPPAQPSDDTTGALSNQEAATGAEEAVSEGEEASEEATPPPEIEPEPRSPQERLAELQSRVDGLAKGEGDPLTSDERSEYARLFQGEQDRARAETQRREQNRQARQRISELDTRFGTGLLEAVTSEIENATNEGRNISPTLLAAAIDGKKSEFMKEIAPLVLQPLDATIEQAFFQMTGNTPQAHDAWDSAATHEQRLDLWAETYAQSRIAESTDAKKMKSLNDENASLKAEIRKLQAGRGTGSGASTNGRAAAADGRSEDDILADPHTPIEKINEILNRRNGVG